MKKSKFFAAAGGLGIAVLSVFLMSSDHIDAPLIKGTSTDIADFYAFEGENSSNFVFVANVQGLLPPGSPTEQAVFDESVLIEFNIDRNNDLKEDVVIQAIPRGEYMYFFGPVAPADTGLESEIATFVARDSVKISTTTDVHIGESNGKQYFAGPREDPFYFDFNQFNAILDGTAPDGFNNPGDDTFAGTNVLSVVVEIPKSMLGAGTTGVNPFAPNKPIYNVWVETKRKQ